MRHPIVQEYHIYLRNLPNAFEGYRIVQFTDLHLGRPCPVAEALSWAAKLDMDLVVLTGDIIHTPEQSKLGQNFIRALVDTMNPVDGFIGVLGNHDGYDEPLMSSSEKVRWLLSETVRIARCSAHINIVGVGQPSWESTDVCSAIRGVEAGETTVVVTHFPGTILLVYRFADLVVAGHTHGGQIRLPGMPFFTNDQLGWRHGLGISRLGNAQMVVCPGLGYSGLFDFRLFSKPEVGVIVLHCQQSGGDVVKKIT